MRIPILDLQPEIQAHWEEFTAAAQSVLASTQFIGGPNVHAFEKEIAAYLGVKHAVSCNSGTDALIIGLRALGVEPGDEVITSPFTFFATAESVSLVGAKPVFVDIDPVTFNLNIDQVEARITSRTKAIVPVHLFGNAADMEPLCALAKSRGLKILEDSAQAMGGEYFGRKLGSIGDLGAFSFFPSKNLGAFGDGGCMVTNSDEVADTCRLLRNHGSRKRYHNEKIGYCSRLDEIQAAFLRVKLKYLDESNQGRCRVASRYKEMFHGATEIVAPTEARGARHVFHQYTIRVLNGRRDYVHKTLGEAGIATMLYYPIPLHRLDVYKNEEHGPLPATELACEQVLSLPIWPALPAQVQLEVCEAVRKATLG